MTNAQTEPLLIQEELMSALLEGEEPDFYVVISAAALSSQVRIALEETKGKDGYRPGEASARLVRNLGTIGFTKSTRPGALNVERRP